MSEGEVFDVSALLERCNPWWRAAADEQDTHGHPDVPRLLALLQGEAPPHLIVIEGARQTGKSVLLSALARALLADGLPPGRLCQIALDHSPLRWSSPERLEHAWRARHPGQGREVMLIDDLQAWPTAQLDQLARLARAPGRTLVVAGSVDRAWVAHWRESELQVARLRLATANFAGHLALRAIRPSLPDAPRSLRELFDWPRSLFAGLGETLRALDGAFEDYLARGGYPQAQRAETIPAAQRYLREQAVTRALRWDAASLHGVRRGADLELMLDYLAARTGNLLDVPDLCARLSVERPTARHFLELLEELGLLHRIPPLGYGDRVQRARFLICLQDPALAPALLWQRANAGLAESERTAQVESAMYRHLLGAYGARGVQLRYAPLGRRGHTLVVDAGQQVLPFALNYVPVKTGARALGGLAAFCSARGVQRAYVATRLADDFGPLQPASKGPPAIMRVPAPLLCLWLAAAETPAIDFA